MKEAIAIVLCLFTITAAGQQPTQPTAPGQPPPVIVPGPQTPAQPDPQRKTPVEPQGELKAALPQDVGSPDTIIQALYEVISGPAGKRDWDRLRSLFVPGARMIPTGKAPDGSVRQRVLTVEEYIERTGPMFAKEGFYESEVARRTEEFGNIAHAWSTYEARREKGAAPFLRGINSIQLLNDGKRWWVVSIMWQAEGPGLTLPEKYSKP